MLEFGLRRGFSVPVVKDRSQEIMQGYALKKQAQHEAESKAKMFADDFDYNNAINEYDSPRIKQYSQGKIKEIGTFIRENPDWERNVEKRVQYKSMIKDLKNNPDLNRGLQSDAARKDWDQWKADPKNSRVVNSSRGQLINEKWKNYEQFGHQDGEEGLKRDGGPKAFSFVPPNLLIDVRQKGLEIGSKLGTTDTFTSGGFGAKVTAVDSSKIWSSVNAEASGNNAEDWDISWEDESPTVKSLYFQGKNQNDPLIKEQAKKKWMYDIIESGTDVKRDKGQQWQQSRSSEGGNGLDPVYTNVLSQQQGTDPYIKAMTPLENVGGKQYFTPVQNRPIRYISKDKNGNEVFKTLQGYDGQRIEGGDPINFKNINGKTYGEVTFRVPLKKHLTQGEDAIVGNKSANKIFYEGDYEADDYNTLEGMQGIADVDTQFDEKGNEVNTGYLNMRGWVQLVNNAATQQKYNNDIAGQSTSNKSVQQRAQSLQLSDQMKALDSIPEGQQFQSNGKVYVKQNGKIIPVK